MQGYSRSEQAFLLRLTQVIEAKMTNSQFGVNELALEMGMSRSSLHRQLKKINSESISHFICKVRLKKAMELLQKNSVSAAEIAYNVGFSSPAYFSRCFHDHFGFPPGEVKKRFAKEASDENEVAKVSAEKNVDLLDDNRLPRVQKRSSIYRTLIPAIFFVLIVIVGTWFFYHNRGLSIIVLPFENFSDNQESEHLAEGIQEDILNDLYQITDLRVISRTSAEQFRNTKLSARKIAQMMKVKYVLEGSVRWYDDKVRISTQLIDAYPFREDHVWSDDFDRTLDDFIGVSDEISLKVASNVKASLTESEIKQIQKIPTQNSLAYDYYLQARFLLHKANSPQRSGFNKEGAMNCIRYYEKAIAEDENFAEAYAGLANAWLKLSAWKFIPTNEGFLKGREFSLKALEMDPDCAEAYSVLGTFQVWAQRNFEEGGKSLQTSIRLNPNFASSRQVYAQYLMITGPIEEARIHVNRALELEPYFWVVQNLNSWIFYFEGKYKDALEACTLAQDFNPNFSSNNWLFVLNYAKLGEGEKMKQKLQSIAKRYSKTDDYADDIQRAFDKNGIDGLFEWLIDTNKNNPIKVEGMNGHPFFIAWWNAIIGNKEEALHYLEETVKAKRKPYHYFNLICTNPDFDSLHHDPRFLKIVDDIGLTPYYNRKAK